MGNRITKNIISQNNIGIEWGTYYTTITDTIVCNKIFNDTLYDFYNTSTSNFQIDHNDWNDTVTAHIRSKIYDGYVNANVGLINFLPIDTSQCYLTGCNLFVSANVTNPTCGTCNNGSATAIVHNGTAPYTYTWYTSPLQSSATATSLDTGTYTLCVHDANGCNACNNIVVGLGAVNCSGFAISTTNQNATCASCTDGSAKVIATGGTTPYNYTWYTSPLQTTDSAVGLSHGTYHVCVTDHAGCVLCDSATINIGNCSAHFNLLPDTILHHYFAVNMASGAAPLSYSWSWGDGTPNDTGAYPNHTYSSAGFYTICLTIIDAVSCHNTYCDSFYLLRSKNAMITVNVVPAKRVSTGISAVTMNDERLMVYPNPANERLIVNGKLLIGNTKLEVTDLLGRIVWNQQINNSINQQISIDVSKLTSQIYILKLTNDKGLQQIVKFVKE
jgi:PKD repeat protein